MRTGRGRRAGKSRTASAGGTGTGRTVPYAGRRLPRFSLPVGRPRLPPAGPPPASAGQRVCPQAENGPTYLSAGGRRQSKHSDRAARLSPYIRACEAQGMFHQCYAGRLLHRPSDLMPLQEFRTKHTSPDPRTRARNRIVDVAFHKRLKTTIIWYANHKVL